MDSDRFEAGFVVESTPAEVWGRLDAARPRGSAADSWWLPGFDGTGTQIEADAPLHLAVLKDHMPCEGTTISIDLTARGDATGVTVLQTDFAPGFVEGAGEAFPIVCDQIEADLRLYLERGVHGGRHGCPWVFLGFEVDATPFGLEVSAVHDETYAARGGVEVGDLLLTLAGAPVVDHRDLTTLSRVIAQGDPVTSTWVRGADRREVSAQV